MILQRHIDRAYMAYQNMRDWPAAHMRERRRWRGRRAAASGTHVFYGMDEMPDSGKPVVGGIVKTLDLHAVYPNTPVEPNLIYLVSSALPRFSGMMVRSAKRRGARLVLNQNGVAYPAWHGPGWEHTNKPLRRMLHQADRVVYQSAFCQRSADRYLGRYAGPSSVLYNPVDTDVFNPLSGSACGPRLLLMGSHHMFYRVASAIEMMAVLAKRVEDVSLHIAGRYLWGATPEASLAEAKGHAERHGVADRITFGGAYRQDEAPGLYRSAAVLVHTKYLDPCPRVGVEGMACGLPILYSGSGGVPELVGSAGGIGVPAPEDWDHVHAPDPVALAVAAEQLLRNRTRYAAAARSRATNELDVDTWVAKHETAFRETLAGRGEG